MRFIFTPFFFLFALSVWPFGGSREPVPREEASLELPANPEYFEYVRVALATDADKVMIEAKEPFEIFDREGRLLMKGKSIAATRVDTNGKQIRIGTQVFSHHPLTLVSKGQGIKIGKRVYRDTIIVYVNAESRLDIINELNLEAYLRGVLPREVNPKWSMETLKAQAIVARSYALFQMIRNQERQFDVKKDIGSQVYGGKTDESTRTNQAVIATRGQVLTHGGGVLSAYYHAACGGTTTRADLIWNIKPNPAMKGIYCEFCKGSKHYRWKADYTFAEIESALKKKEWNVQGVYSIETSKRDASGRVVEFVLETQNGKVSIPSNQFRMALDPFEFKSTLIDSAENHVGDMHFKGRGWGHGVGFCQWGAKKLGELGYSYKQILEYYYPDTDIVKYGT